MRSSNPFLADPKRFNPDAAPPAPESLVWGVRAHEVVFPATKALLWDTHLAFLQREPALPRGFDFVRSAHDVEAPQSCASDYFHSPL